MKSIFKYIGILTIAAVALASCKKEDSYQPGDPEEANCYGVYFPSQDASGSHTYDPTAAKTITITAARTNSKGAITVPVTVTSNVEGVFDVDPIQFADGQEETTFEVKFPNIKIGENSEFHITVADNQYASKYAEGSISFDCSILCVEWQYFLNPKTGEKALITWEQGFWGETATGYLKYYEVDGVRTCQTETSSTHVYNGSSYTGYGFLGTADSAETATEWTFIWYPDFEDNLGNQLMQLPTQKSGWHHSTYNADVYIFDVWNYYNTVGGNSYDWKTYSAKYSMDGADSSYPVSYYDGNGGFYLYPWRYYMLGIGGWSTDPYETVGVAEGFTRVDYYMDMSADLSSEGVLPVNFALGADVAKVKFQAFEGELTAGQISNQTEKLPTMTDAFEVVPATADWDDDDACYYVTSETTLAASGTYTLIAVALDKDGNVQGSASVVATYVAAGDDQTKYAVDLTCGVGSAEKYPGVNTDNALEVWAYGTDIVDAKVAVFSKADLSSNYDGCVESLLSSKSLSEENVAAISDGGYVAVAKSLLPGTEYYVMVYASNGYLEDVFVSETSCFTTGDPLPIYKKYTYNDYAGSTYNFGTKDETVGKTFNCYATDLFGSLGMNEYIGKCTIADNSYSDGTFTYITMKGLAGPYATKYKFDDSFAAILASGVIYPSAQSTCDSTKTIYCLTEAGNAYKNGRYQYFMAVADGYYALCASSGNYSAGYDFCGLGWYNGGFYAAYVNYILVDPAKDDNGLAPTAASTISAPRMLQINRAKSLDESMSKPSVSKKSVTAYSNLKLVKGATCPAQVAKATVKTVHGVRPAKVDSRSQAPRKDFKVSL